MSNYGVQCKYTLLTGVGAFISQTTKVFIDADYVLGNGGVVATIGTSMLSYLAHQYKVPVIALCETYKFTQRVNLDQVKNNQLFESSSIVDNSLDTTASSGKVLSQRNLKVHCLKYDFTPTKCVRMILSEIGKVSPVSVSGVVEEFNAEKGNK